jgi:acetyl-CoA carboxylase carboxyltransferase component
MDYQEARKRFVEERQWAKNNISQKSLDRQRARGKRHVLERIDQLVDKGSWLEYGEFARAFEPIHKNKSPRDGTITGLGRINGQSVAILGDDITTLGGTQSIVNERKVDRILEIAVRNNFPIVSLSEGGGVRLPDGIGVGFTRLCGLHKVGCLSTLANWRKRPLFICGVFGFTYGDPAFRSAMADITVMVQDSSAAVSAPMVLEAAISEKISDEKLGGPPLHESTTGVVDIVTKTEDEAIDAIKKIIDMFRPAEEPVDPLDRPTPSLESLIPHNNRLVYDMRKVIDDILDHAEWIEFKPHYGTGLIIGLGRMAGRLTGILASQPLSGGGAVDAKGLRKSAGFLDLVTKRGIPLLVIQDIPGFLVGSGVEKDGMLSAIANHARALDAADVPMVTLIIRKAYGAAYYFLGMGGSGAQFVAAWPNAEISFIAPEIGATVLTKNVPREKKEEALNKTATELSRGASIWEAAYEGWIDAVILPEETRKVISHAFQFITQNLSNKVL